MSKTFQILEVGLMDQNIRNSTINLCTTEDLENLHKHGCTYFKNLDHDPTKYFQ